MVLRNVTGLRSFSRKLLPALLILFLASSVVSNLTAAENLAKVQAFSQMAKQLLRVGAEQYDRGLYEKAQLALLKAAKYKEYLNAQDTRRLNNLLEKVLTAATEKNQVIEHLRTGEKLLQQGKLSEAKASLELVRQSSYLSSQQRQRIAVDLKIIQQKLNAQKDETVELYDKDVELFNEDKLTEAYDEFAEAKPKSDILVLVGPEETETELEPEPETELEPETEPEPETIIGEEEQFVEPAEPKEASYIDVVNQKRRVQQSYTKAIVDNSMTKAKKFAEVGEFTKARDEITRAGGVVNNNKLLLGDTVYKSYMRSMDELLETIAEKQTEVQKEKSKASQAEAGRTQKRLIERQRADRQNRIEDLMNNALEYQDQQRYSEALGQLETLLAIDPTNRNAVVMKRGLEDVINLTRQLRVKEEIERQELDILYETRKSMVPHAEDMTFPDNWPELTRMRKAEALSGLDPLDAAVYKQLQVSVDLSALHPDMALDEAIREIRNSVEPPLKLTVRWRDLDDNAYIGQDAKIGMQGLSGIRLGKGLKELLKSVSGGVAELNYVIEDGIITIATKESLPGKLIPRVYDISELIGIEATFYVDVDASIGSSGSGGGSSGGTGRSRGSGGSGGGTGTAGASEEENITSIVETMQETIEPDSWYINGGEGTITSHGNRLIISQTPEIHDAINQLIEDLRESLGQQVAIEARFLFVTENFLEYIGIDSTISIAPMGKLSRMTFVQGSFELAEPGSTPVPGSLGTTTAGIPALDLFGGATYGSILDDLTVSFFLKATQAHRDAKALTAPKVTVLSGETAYIRVTKESSYVADYDFEDITASGDDQPTRVIADPDIDTVIGGVILNVTPTISSDKRYVLLTISTSFTRFDLDDFTVFSSESGEGFPIQLPVENVAEVQTRVSVPDRGTLLIGGQKLGAETNKEAGVPGLSKIPILGRLFRNRSKVKDQDILLILVKPTIILQDEAEREAFAPLE